MRSIEVQCHAGHKADESPRRFRPHDRWIEIEQITDRWYQGSGNPEWPIADYFKVADLTGRTYLLRHDREVDMWYLVGGV